MAHRRTAGGLDFRGDRVGVGGGSRVPAKIVDDDPCATLGQRQCVTAAESLAGSRDDGDLAIESDSHRLTAPDLRWGVDTMTAGP